MITATPSARPGLAVLTGAIELAIRAPSIHNTQPWRWRIHENSGIGGLRLGSIDLFADRSRQLRIADPGGRALLVSCGAALYQAQLALRAAGWRSVVTRMPNPLNDDHLATILVTGRAPATADALRLAAAARRRRTDRRPFANRPVDPAIIECLRYVAEQQRVFVHEVRRREDRLILSVAAGRANEIEADDQAYGSELKHWSGRTDDSLDGIPISAVPDLPDRRCDVPLRDLPGTLRVPPATQVERPLMLVIGTGGDSPLDRLVAGEAVGRILLETTELGLSASPYTQPLEIPGPQYLMRRVVGGVGMPQILLRIGWPGPGPEPRLTPRRPVSEVLGTAPAPYAGYSPTP
ncbi:MAG: NAD(P)H nitroreductase [Mycobacterium sp.]|nr:NAD(P)H nitroreductase [Mycobacterium sp.]